MRGGKVIGKGYNDYKPRFNGGGTLKTGRFGASASASSAIVALKQKTKSKDKQIVEDSKPLEYNLGTLGNNELGGGCLANSPLSMHSEMMAIQSALSRSGNTTAHGSARSSQLMQKPGSYKLSGRGKRQLHLRTLKAYLDTVCEAALVETMGNSRPPIGTTHGAKAQIQGSSFEPSASQCSQGGAGSQRGGGEEGEGERTAVHSEEYCERPQEACVRPSTPQSGPPPDSREGTYTTSTRRTTGEGNTSI